MTSILTIAFGTTVAMWGVGYLCRMPPGLAPSWLLLILLLVCLVLGGMYSGSRTERGIRGGVAVGVLTGTLNLLVLGSLLTGDRPNQIVPSAVLWLPGSLIVGGILGGLGAFLGRRFHRTGGEEVDWTSRFSLVAAGATLLLLVAGGLVTSEKAGLAVVDWPNSFGYAMFLYPLSRMTGGIYFEHAHRLFGSLVGLTTLVLTVLILRRERRGWVRRFALFAFLLVIVQGVLGGLRVTGRFTMSASHEETRPSTVLAIIHGITGQLFFAALALLGAFTSRTWRSVARPLLRRSAGIDQTLGGALFIALCAQLVLGAMLRHVSKGLLIHITMATVVVILAVAVGARAAAMPDNPPLLRRQGKTLLVLLSAQVALGIGSLAARTVGGGTESLAPLSVIVRTAHQACGALLLAAAALLTAWNHRLLRSQAPAGAVESMQAAAR